MVSRQTEINRRMKAYYLREARKDRAWAKKTVNDKEWLRMASDMSKEMLYHYLNTPAKKLAAERYKYWKMRSHSGIDRAAMLKWEKIGKTRIRKRSYI